MKPTSFSVGEEISASGRTGRIVRVLDFDQFLVRFDNGDTRVITSEAIERGPPIRMPPREYQDCTPEEIEEAYRWHAVLQPLLGGQVKRGERIAFLANAAERLQISRATLYRRVDQWNGDPVSLLPGKRPGGVGKSRLGQEREALLAHVIDKEFLSKRQRGVREVYKDFILPAFKQAGLERPSAPTVYRYVKSIDPIVTIERRIGKRAAREAKAKLMGKFPFGTAPLACVQIDYWFYDAQIVDDVERLPIGRPWLAMIIDTHTCMPCGFTLTLDPPSAGVAGSALFHAITRKEAWLREVGFEMIWPVWGLPRMLMADNAKEFRGTMLRRFLGESDSELINRPVKRPRYGAHIERFFGTLAEKIKSVPGSTGSNVKEKKERNSEQTAALTLRDLEIHLLSVLKEYMHTEHASLGGLTPLQKWRSCFFENGQQVRELPEEPGNLEQLRIELLPFKMLTLQQYGVVWDKIHYDSDELVATRHRHMRDKGMTFTVRRDPRDISRAYVWDPDNKRYLTVPYRVSEGSPMNIWELKAVRVELKERGQNAYTEREIFDAFAERQQRHARLEEAGKLTKKIQRQNQQKRSQKVAIAREQSVIAAHRGQPVDQSSISARAASPYPLVEPARATAVPAPDDYDDLDI